jgi:hypothetical protein
MKIISADQRLVERRGVKALIVLWERFILAGTSRMNCWRLSGTALE